MDNDTPGSTPQHEGAPTTAETWGIAPIGWTDDHQVCDEQLAAARCLYADTFDGRCALAATADSPPPERVQMAELVRDNERLRQQCDKWRGIADAFADGVEHSTAIVWKFETSKLKAALAQWREAQ